MMTMDGDDVNDDIIIIDIDDDGQVTTRSMKKKDTTIKKTHHHINQLRNGLDKGPDPFSVGLWVDGAMGPAWGKPLRNKGPRAGASGAPPSDGAHRD